MSACPTLGALLVTVGLACSTMGQDTATDLPAPHFDARGHTPQYVGPPDRRGDAAGLSEIRIGYFGPSDPQHPLHGQLWRAAQRAVDEANQRGGFAGKRYRLVPAWSDNPWGSGVTQVTQLVYREHVWAIVGGVDGPTTHLAEQVVVKARLALVSPVSTDKTVNLTNVPWMFSLAPNDHQVADVLADEITRRMRGRRLSLITTNDHDAFLLTRELRRAMTACQIAPSYQYEYQPQSQDVDLLVQQCLASKPDGLVVIANAPDSLRLVRAVRRAGFAGCIFGGPALGREQFVREIADVAGEVVFPRIDEAACTAATASEQEPTASLVASDIQDDYAALHMYDAVNIVIAAIDKAGLSRVEIARAIRDLSPISGASGRIEWDPPGGNTRRPTLATLAQGRVVPLGAD